MRRLNSENLLDCAKYEYSETTKILNKVCKLLPSSTCAWQARCIKNERDFHWNIPGLKYRSYSVKKINCFVRFIFWAGWSHVRSQMRDDWHPREIDIRIHKGVKPWILTITGTNSMTPSVLHRRLELISEHWYNPSILLSISWYDKRLRAVPIIPIRLYSHHTNTDRQLFGVNVNSTLFQIPFYSIVFNLTV